MAEDVIVAGAGIGGLAAALALARSGRKVTVVERAAEITEVGAGVQLGPNAFTALRKLGLAEAMEAVCFSPRAVVMRDSDSNAQLARQELGGTFVQRFGEPYRVGFRADVQRVILDAVVGMPDLIDLRLGRGVIGVAQDADGVQVRLDDGDVLPGAALVGADGLWSQVRRALGDASAPRVSGHIAYRAVVPVEHVPPEILSDDVQVWVGPQRHLVSYRLRRGRLLNIVAIIHSARYVEGWNRAGDPRELRRGFEGACAPVLGLIEQIAEDARMWVLCDRDPQEVWSEGRVTLLGDAAHPMLPYLAQGASMALEDAVFLAEALAPAPDDPAEAFRAYQDARAPRTRRVQLAARASGESYHADGERRDARNAALAQSQPQNYEANAWLFDPATPTIDREERHDRAVGLFARARP